MANDRLAVSKSTKRGYVNVRVYEPSNPNRVAVRGKPMLWRHRNGYWYILYGHRLKRQLSTQTKDRALAEASLATFMGEPPYTPETSALHLQGNVSSTVTFWPYIARKRQLSWPAQPLGKG